MKQLKRGRRPKISLKIKIAKLIEQDFSYPEIAKMLGLKSRQAVRYHYVTSEKFSTGEGIDKKM